MSLLCAKALHLPDRLERTDLVLEAGTLTILIGPNGSGKTSLLHAIAGIGSPFGSVTVDGTERDSLGPGVRQRLLTFLPASRDMAWPLTGMDLITLGGGKAEPLMEVLGLSALANRRVDRMSTGERSRILIARALAPDPHLLLLDEPTANLDPLWQIRLMDHLRALARENGRAVLAALHDLELASQYADRLIIMNERRIEADGPPAALLEGPDMRRIFGVERANGAWRLSNKAGEG